MQFELDENVPFSKRTLPEILKMQARLGNRPFIKYADGTIRYEQAPQLAGRCAGRLAAVGLGPGSRILVLLPNGPELIEQWLGSAWLGAILVPVNTAVRGAQLRHVVETTRPDLIVVEASLMTHLSNADIRLPYRCKIWVVGGELFEKKIFSGAATSTLPPPGNFCLAQPVLPGENAAILYTSGTSGLSKGVMCPHAQFFWWGIHTGQALELTRDDTLFTVLPLFHTNALNAIWQALLHGATFALGTRFSASRFWPEAQSTGATVTYLLGTMVHILLKAEPTPEDLNHNIRVALSPATSSELTQQFKARFGIRLIEGYGSTETNFVMSNVLGGYFPGAMGRVVEGFEARVVDDQDCDVQDGTPGELIIRHHEPYSMSNGYFGDPDATVKSWRNLWFHTGDRVIRDANGVYHFCDRLKDSIRRRGENISSTEVETALYAHPEIEKVAVIGVPAEASEEEVMSFIVPRSGCKIDPRSLIDFLKGKIAYFAIPRYIEIVDELPETENGKIRKFLLKERGVTRTTWDRESAGVSPIE